MKKFRFFVADSPIYGITVYDRETQQPAFGYGAATDMDDIDALFLSHRLNAAVRLNKLMEVQIR